MELCTECREYTRLYYMGSTKKMFPRNICSLTGKREIVIFKADNIICNKCGHHIDPIINITKGGYHIKSHSSIKNPSITILPKTYNILAIPPVSRFILCKELGNLLVIKQTAVYLDLEITCKIGQVYHYILSDGRLIRSFADRDTKLVFIDEYGEYVPYNTIPSTSQNTYEDEKHRIVVNGNTAKYTNKMAGLHTKPAIRLVDDEIC